MECADADTFTATENRHCPNHGGCGLRMRAVMSAVRVLAAGRNEPHNRVPVRRAVVPGVPGKERRALSPWELEALFRGHGRAGPPGAAAAAGGGTGPSDALRSPARDGDPVGDGGCVLFIATQLLRPPAD